jgi:hypothetical protein
MAEGLKRFLAAVLLNGSQKVNYLCDLCVLK